MFFGPYEIEKEEVDGNHIRVFFKKTEEGKEVPSILTSKTILDKSKTEEPGDLSELRKIRCEVMFGEIMDVFLKHNLMVHSKAGDWEHLTGMLATALDNNQMLADKLRWGIHPYNMSIQDVHKEILSHKEDLDLSMEE